MLNWAQRGHVLATTTDDVVYCQVVGLANMNNSAPFEAFARRRQDSGCREFILDFSLCEGLDSTFLGIVLGLRLGGKPEVGHPQITAVNVSKHVLKILAEVGIDRLIQVLPDPVSLPEIPLKRLERDCSEEERLGMILSAHETLCDLGIENQARFGSFVDLLRQELGQDSSIQPRPASSRSEGEGA